MTKEKCSQCQNQGIVGACQGRYDTGMNWVCNFMPKSGSVNIVIRSNVNGTGDDNGYLKASK